MGYGSYSPQRPQEIKVVTNQKSKWKMVFYVILIVAIIFGVNMYKPQLLNAYNSLVNRTEGAFQPITSTLSSQGAQQYAAIWGTPASQAPEQNKISLDKQSSTNIGNNSLSFDYQLSITPSEDMTISAQCYLDGNKIETTPNQLPLAKSDSQQHRSLKCSNPVGGKQLSVKLEIPLKVSSDLVVWTGTGKNLGIIHSVMNHASLYSLLLTTSNDQPLPKRDIPYSLFVKIKKEKDNVLLERIDSLKVSTTSSSLSIECPFGTEFSGSRSDLARYLVIPASDAYSITCNALVSYSKVNVSEAQTVRAEMSYTVQEEFKTALS